MRAECLGQVAHRCQGFGVLLAEHPRHRRQRQTPGAATASNRGAMLADLPQQCDIGRKKNTAGHEQT
jgi:hypothetical protein